MFFSEHFADAFQRPDFQRNQGPDALARRRAAEVQRPDLFHCYSRANFKLLDWVVRATGSRLAFSEGQPITVTALVDRLWERWLEDDGSA